MKPLLAGESKDLFAVEQDFRTKKGYSERKGLFAVEQVESSPLPQGSEMFQIPTSNLIAEQQGRMEYLTWRAFYVHRIITDLLAEGICLARVQDSAQDNVIEEVGRRCQQIDEAPASRDPATIIEAHVREWLDIGREMNDIRDAARRP